MNRLQEPSTWAGFAALFQMFAAFVPPQYALPLHAITVVAGTLATVMAEGKAPAAVAPVA